MSLPSLRQFARATACATALVLSLSSVSRAAEAAADDDDTAAGAKRTSGKILNMGTRKAEADIAPASNEGEQALKRMKLPPGLVASLWAAEPMLANPVAFNFDEKGRIYVAETYRYRTSVLDIRDYMWTLENELTHRTIEDQSAAILRHFGPEGVKELSIESERIRLLEDTDRTGVATKSTLFAEGFNSPLDGIASGVLARRGTVWFANIPSIWRFDGQKPDGTPAKRTEISRGYGVRFNFTGHDLHGLAIGPDGKLYFSNGDRGASAKGPDGSIADTPDEGAVYRSNLDGTQLEVFARGLRNPQSIAFTENGDLLTGDNDCDKGDEERLVHVVEGGDSGWRVGYQHPLIDKDNPWLAEKLWQPRTKDTAAYLLSPICNIEDGPSGITYYPGTGLNDSYRGSLFITHFKGSIARSGIYTYNVKPKGSSYAIADSKPFLQSALPTDVKFGPDGRLYTSDWADGWPKSKRGRIYAISDPKHAKDALVLETQKLIAQDWTKASVSELTTQLGHADQRVRQEAQFTFAERGAASIAPLSTITATPVSAGSYARLHAIWALGQLAPKNPAALDPLRKLLRDSDSEVRAQSAKVLGEVRDAASADALIAALEDSAPRVKFFAAQSLGKLKHAAAAPALIAALRANADQDEYLRHALVMGLVGGNNVAAFTAAMTSDSRSVRLGLLLAFRRLQSPLVAKFLADADPLVAREAVLAINDAPIPAAYPQLAALISKPLLDEGIVYRILNAHFRLGQPANAAALAAYAGNPDAPAKLRAEAVAQLAHWPTPPARDRLVGNFLPLPTATRDATVAVNALLPILPGLLDAKTSSVIQAAVLKAIESLEIKSAADTLFAVVKDNAQPAANRAAALRALDKLKDSRVPEAVKIASDQSPLLRQAALPISSRLSPDAAAPVLANLVTKGTVIEQKTALRALGTLQHPLAATTLIEQLTALAAGKVPAAIQLDVLNAAELRNEPAVKKLLADREAALAKNPDPLAAFQVTLRGGDRARGEKIFNNQPVMACVRCHKVGTESGGEAGPNLADMGTKYDRPYLLEALLKPNATVAPGYDTIVLTLKSGGAAAGIVASETTDTITLRNTDNKLVEVKKSNIAKRDSAPSGMPEIYGAILTKSEIRDVVEYMASLRSRPDQRPEESKPRALRTLTAE